MIRKYSKWFVGLILLAFCAPVFLKTCSSDSGGGQGANVVQSVGSVKELPSLSIPEFNADSAYLFTEKIVSFGPRVTGTPNDLKVKAWVLGKFRQYGADIIEQNYTSKTYKGKELSCKNIIARYNVQDPNRVVLFVHSDTRDVADQDSVRKNEPIVGADDSGSGMGTLLEVARNLQLKSANIGVDIVFLDAEDLGAPQSEEGWCLGSKYWSANLHVPNYKPKYGILLDMAGAKDARFCKEQISYKYAGPVVEKVWRVGRNLGYTNHFVEEYTSSSMTDDHLYINEIAHIPTIDIINHPGGAHFFGEYWHTHRDNMSIIDRETLRAVGRTLLHVLHYEGMKVL
jgi:glutaminyl-peptide cyclotransferase